jgi:hypothetical protein
MLTPAEGHRAPSANRAIGCTRFSLGPSSFDMVTLGTRPDIVGSSHIDSLVPFGPSVVLQSCTVTHAPVRDVDIRRRLHAEVRRRHAAEIGTLFLDELGLCQGVARVDFAVINGSLHGYEIKSECDTLDRLPGQRDVYGRALDFVTIVTSAKHAKKIRSSVPQWWGIWTANSSTAGVKLRQVRRPRQNPSVDARAVAELLWRDEALEELEARELARGLRGKPRHELWARLADSMPLPELCAIVRGRLKRRRRWRVAARPM